MLFPGDVVIVIESTISQYVGNDDNPVTVAKVDITMLISGLVNLSNIASIQVKSRVLLQTARTHACATIILTLHPSEFCLMKVVNVHISQCD